jgi:HK97 family phage portal protein
MLWGSRASLLNYGVEMRTRGRIGTGRVSRKRAMQNSIMWSATRLRANLISSLPLQVLKDYAGSAVPAVMTKPRVLITPYEWATGHPMHISEFMYQTQTDLDREGNTFGVILERDGNRLPSKVLPVPVREVTLVHKNCEILGYLIGGVFYEPDQVWHERQYSTSDFPLGLSPIAHAAFSLESSVSAQEFALGWFRSGATPSALLTNKTAKVIDTEAEVAKRRWDATTSNGEIVVLGKDWEYTQVSSGAKAAQFLEQINASDVEIARFMDAPADLLDLHPSGQSITYANITERHLQFLVLSLGPAIQRRETALGRLTLGDRYVKANTDAFLRMDPAARNEQLRLNKAARIATVTETRALLNLPPLTAAQIAEIAADAALASKAPVNTSSLV